LRVKISRKPALKIAALAVALFAVPLIAATPANAVVDGSVVAGGYYNDPRPNPNPYAFVGLWELGGSFCTASLVSPDYVLTAGHCAGNARVTFNVLNRDRDLGTDAVEIRNVVEYKWQDDAPGAPIMGPTLLAKLDKPITDIAPVRMPDKTADKSLWATGSRLSLLGWGFINDSDTVRSAELRSAELKVADNAISLPPLRGMMKMNHVSGYGTHGDSGAPLVGRNSRGDLVQVGIFEGSLGPGHQYFNRLWPQGELVDFINSHQYVATPSAGG
jgi:hypothetical protein